MKRVWPRITKRPERRQISEKTFAAIESRARQFKDFSSFKLTQADRAEVREAAEQYQIDESLQAAALPLKTAIESIQLIAKRTKELIWLLEHELAGDHGTQLHALLMRRRCDPDDTVYALNALELASAGAGRDLRALNGPGRDIDIALEQLVCRLAILFETKGYKASAPYLANSERRASAFVELVLGAYRVAHPTDRRLPERSIEDRIHGALQRRQRAMNSKKAS